MKTNIQRETFCFRYDPDAGEFSLESAGGCLRLACQGAVSQPGLLDAGLAWEFVESKEDGKSVLLRFAAAQTCWQKKYLCVEITRREVLFRLEVEGCGSIDRVAFFAGFSPDLLLDAKASMGALKWARPSWNRHWSGSPLSFGTVFNPQPVIPGAQRLSSGVSQRITCATTFGPEVFNTFFAPPLFAYGFDDAFSVGIAAPMDASRFNHFDFTSTSGWGLELHYDGKTSVDGRWGSPAIRVATCSDAEAGLSDYANYLRQTGIAPEPSRDIPSWARRPMVCGWGQQTVWAGEAQKGTVPSLGTPITPGAGGYASQAAYEEIIRLLEERDLPYGTLTVDMGWSRCLTIPTPDERMWPDMKGFIERLHKKGKRVFLWLATWNPGGLDDVLKMPHGSGLSDCCDPTNPVFRERLAEAVTQAISPDGLNADGFKVDFTGDLPRGNYQPAGKLWGLELMHDYLKLIHDAMKAAKADTVLETHCANPQFADVTEMIRLNDIFSPREEIRKSMEFRARMARIALPGYPIDTDNDPFISRLAWMDYMRFQPQLGMPSLYTLTHVSFTAPGVPAEAIPSDDWDEIRSIWKKYNEELYGD
ncbi:MAG: TIM-barrel domain-containing protein [Victivallales bacterium]